MSTEYKTKRDIWEKFGVDPGSPEQINVIGVDNGAGELVYCRAVKKQGKIELETLPINNNNDKWNYTAYKKKEEQGFTEEIIGKEVLLGNDKGCAVYTDFKTPPEKADECYDGENISGGDKEASVTKKDLMSQTFYCLMRKLVEVCSDYLEGSRTILFVGRPASDLWEDQELEYQKILMSGLGKLKTDMGWTQKMDVIAYSEAKAAMAYEYFEHNMKPGEVVVVIDAGSSTFDCEIIKDGRVLNEYSRQVGAGMIDKNMLDIIFMAEEWAPKGENINDYIHSDEFLSKVKNCPVFEREKIHKKWIGTIEDALGHRSQGLLMLEFRRRKESYFDDGSEIKFNYTPIQAAKPEKRKIDVDEEYIQTAIESMPVRVIRSYEDEDLFGGDRTVEYDSFKAAAEAFFKGAKQRCEDKETHQKVNVDRIIFTGGATKMPFIQELARDVFEVDKNNIELNPPTDERHYSVAKGLAYMGYVELAKRDELKKLKEKIRAEVGKKKWTIDAKIKDVYVSAVRQEIFVSQMNQWLYDTSMKSLEDWYKIPWHAPVDEVRKGIQSLLEEEGIITLVGDELKKNFKILFPNQEEGKYTFEVKWNSSVMDSFSHEFKVIRLNKMDFLSWTQTAAMVLKNITGSDTSLSYSDKEKIVKRAKAYDGKPYASLKEQVINNTVELRSRIYNAILEGFDETVESYMESNTPYFLQDYV